MVSSIKFEFEILCVMIKTIVYFFFLTKLVLHSIFERTLKICNFVSNHLNGNHFILGEKLIYIYIYIYLKLIRHISRVFKMKTKINSNSIKLTLVFTYQVLLTILDDNISNNVFTSVVPRNFLKLLRWSHEMRLLT